jgi:hypothetical protein
MFNKIKKLAVSSESTAVYEFDVIEGRPSIVVRPATQANPAYLNAVLGEGKALARRGKRAMSVATLAFDTCPLRGTGEWQPATSAPAKSPRGRHRGDVRRRGAIPDRPR